MSLPRNRSLAKCFNGFFLGPVPDLEPGPVTGLDLTIPTFDQQPLTVQQAAYIFWGVKQWQLSGSITFTWIAGGDDPPSPYTLTFDSGAVTTINWGGISGPLVADPVESQIGSAQYCQNMAWTSSDETAATASFAMFCGAPNAAPFDPTTAYSFVPLLRQAGQYFLGNARQGFLSLLQIVVPGYATLTNAQYSGRFYAYSPLPDSGIDFKILGLSQTLWTDTASSWSCSGTVTLGPASGGYWGCGGRWDPTTGLAT
jgi:hypothetical protein